MTAESNDASPTEGDERSDLLDALNKHRSLLLATVQGLSDEQAIRRTTVSELCLGGILKHVTRMEQRWAGFIRRGPAAMSSSNPESMAAHAASFRVEPGDTLAALVVSYGEAARATDLLVKEVPSLDESHRLPDAPWFKAGSRWSARRVFLHILAELSQHAGHADIIRESLDGQKTMG